MKWFQSDLTGLVGTLEQRTWCLYLLISRYDNITESMKLEFYDTKQPSLSLDLLYNTRL